jgi:hypothetical protein
MLPILLFQLSENGNVYYIFNIVQCPTAETKATEAKYFKNSLMPGDLSGGMQLREPSSGRRRRYQLIDCFIPGGHLAGQLINCFLPDGIRLREPSSRQRRYQLTAF